MFGDRFDFDGDGQNDLEDLYLEMKLVIDEDDEPDEEEPEVEAVESKGSKAKASKVSVSAIREKVEQCKDLIDSKVLDLQIIFDERSINEPDILSARYDAWQDKQYQLEERIDSLEDIVSKLGDLIDQFDDMVYECSDVLGDCELYAAEYKDLSGVLPTLRSLLG